MKSLAVVSFFAMAALFGLPVGAQTVAPSVLPAAPSGVAPPPYQPPYQQMPAPPPEGLSPGQNPEDFANNQVDEAQPQAPLPLPGSDQAGLSVPFQPAQYDPNNPADPANQNLAYPPADLGPDNEIAQSYDDGYDPQAYTQFQTALAPYGSWSDDPTYGNVWSPYASTVGSDFVPYASCGHWLMSEYGWTWISDLSWGWAPFHYGRWIPITGRGWSWVPGTMWGPAWVSWRSGNGYVGWSPLPPRGTRLVAGVGGRSAWRFTTATGLAAAHPSFVNPHYLPSMFARTTVVANDRLLTRGQWIVHVNAGPTRGILATPIRLSNAAPHVLPHLAVYPHPGVSLSARPWMQSGGTGAFRGAYGQPNRGAGAVATGAHAQGWNAGTAPRTLGRTPAYGPAAAHPAMRAPATVWSRPSQPYSGNSAGYGRTTYGAGGSYSTAPRPYSAAAPSYGNPQPAYHAAPAAPAYYRTPTPSSAPAPRSFAPPEAHYSGGSSFSGGGGSHFGGGGNHFGGGGGSHFGGGGGGVRRR